MGKEETHHVWQKLIIDSIVGGKIQYRLRTQGISPTITNKLKSLIQRFVWGGKAPRIAMERLQVNYEHGGIRLMVLQSVLR